MTITRGQPIKFQSAFMSSGHTSNSSIRLIYAVINQSCVDHDCLTNGPVNRGVVTNERKQFSFRKKEVIHT